MARRNLLTLGVAALVTMIGIAKPGPGHRGLAGLHGGGHHGGGVVGGRGRGGGFGPFVGASASDFLISTHQFSSSGRACSLHPCLWRCRTGPSCHYHRPGFSNRRLTSMFAGDGRRTLIPHWRCAASGHRRSFAPSG